MATSENGTGKSKKDRKQEFFVHADKVGVLVNYREVHAARLEGRSADAEAH